MVRWHTLAWLAALVAGLYGVVSVAYPPRGAYEMGSALRGGGAQTVAFIGDSIAFHARATIHRLVQGPWYVRVSAAPEAMFREQMEAAREIAGTRPQAVVIHLGTNDTICLLDNAYDREPRCRIDPFVSADLERDQRAMVALFEPGTCILGTSIAFGGATNEIWRELLAEGVIHGIVDWEGYVMEHDRGELLADRLGHLQPPGWWALAQLSRRVLDGTCRRASLRP